MTNNTATYVADLPVWVDEDGFWMSYFDARPPTNATFTTPVSAS
jgi:hypothetical protein